MPFQFMCPQGHLLEAEYSQMGQTINCPTCGMAFIVPTVEVPAEVAAGGAWRQASGEDSQAGEEVSIRLGPETGLRDGAAPDLSGSAMVHYPCKCGQLLQVPRQMLGETVMCPYCGIVIDLQYRKTLEGRRDKQQAEERRLARSGKLWMNWAIVIATLVILGLAGMFIALSQY